MRERSGIEISQAILKALRTSEYTEQPHQITGSLQAGDSRASTPTQTCEISMSQSVESETSLLLPMSQVTSISHVLQTPQTPEWGETNPTARSSATAALSPSFLMRPLNLTHDGDPTNLTAASRRTEHTPST